MPTPNRWLVLTVALVASVALATPASAADPETKLVSVKSNGNGATGGDSEDAAISDNGRFIAFESEANNLSTQDDNTWDNVFVHDLQTGMTELVSLKSNGRPATNNSENPSISRGGRYVAFESAANNLSPDDDNAFQNSFVHDRQTGMTELVTVKSNGNAPNGNSDNPSISNDGRLVAFESDANNLPGPNLGTGEDLVYVHDRQTGMTRLVSKKSNGDPADASSTDALISGNGGFVVFESSADNFPGRNSFRNIYVHDLDTANTELVTKASNGDWADDDSEDQVITCNGKLVAYMSSADNLSGIEDEGFQNVFVHNRMTGTTRLVSKTSGGAGATGGSSRDPDISCGGRYVVIQSEADNLSGADDDAFDNIFVYDRKTGKTKLVSRASDGGAGADDESDLPEPNEGAISPDGAFIVFRSAANNLSGIEDEGFQNVFLRGPLT